MTHDGHRIDNRPKLLVVLGAGSSIGIGMPSVGDLDHCMRRWAEEWTRVRGDPNYYALVERAAEAYALSGSASLRPPVNFERVLADLAALAQWMTPAPFGTSLRQITCGDAGPPTLTFPHPDRYGPSVVLKDQLQDLLTKLAIYMRDRSSAIDLAAPQVQDYGRLFEGLRSTFDCQPAPKIDPRSACNVDPFGAGVCSRPAA